MCQMLEMQLIILYKRFNGLTPDTSWTVWIEGNAWSTVTCGSIKVYYTY